MTVKLFRTLDISFGWLSFIIALAVYSLTVAPSVSFWDCGEFISAAYKLEVGHPPGAPMYLLIGRFFSLFAPDVTQVALAVNMLSVIASAFTILFLYWTIAYFAKRMIAPKEQYSIINTIVIIASSLLGAMVFTFSDTFWFSAVEAEVYGLSSFFTALVFWAMLKWNETDDESKGYRWIIFISLMIGMSIGVHLLNLLAMPAIAMIYYYKNYKPTKIGVSIALIVSVMLIAIVMWGIIPGSVIIASKFELFTVNTLGLAFNSGFILWAIVSVAALGSSVYVTQYSDNKKLHYIIPSIALSLIAVPFIAGNVIINIVLLLGMIYGIYTIANRNIKALNVIMLSATMLMVGYSCYATIIIRSNANPPMDQNNPENVFNLLYYLNREQYGSHPIFRGQYYDAEPVDYAEGDPIYVQRGDRYEKVGYRQIPIYENLTFFPRMYSNQPNHVDTYKAWGGIRASQRTPNFNNNIKFFVNYQLNWMYWRYFMWNFAGRQNDIQGHGNVIHGNWISGIPFIDNPRLGDQSKLPDHLKNNKANNRYYMLPFLLGLIGLSYQLFKHFKDWSVVSLLFILTGIAIIVFLNQTPHQPRERDYAYVGSFYAFAIWVGLGLLAIYQFLKRFANAKIASPVAILLCLPTPIIMASENWDDHDRTGRYIARDFAYNYLISCAPNSILFTYGDNDTFPIWYSQNVEGVGLDVKVACLPYFASDWYVDQMKMATYDADPMPLSYERKLYEPTIRDVVYYSPREREEGREHISLDSLLNYIANDRLSKISFQGSRIHTYHKNNVFMRVDSATVVDNGTVKPENAHLIESTIAWNLSRNFLVKNELMTLDMLRTNKWERPVYFTSIGSQNTLNLDSYFQNEGFAYRLVPIKSSPAGRIDTEILYDNLMNRFRYGNMNDPDIYLDYYIHRTVRVVRIRDNFRRLALQLIREGDMERAQKVMERGKELMPTKLYTPGIFDVNFAEAWYELGDYKNGDQYIIDCIETARQELDFFYSLDNRKFRSCEVEVQMAMEVYRRALNILANRERELYEKYEPIFTNYMMRYQNRMN